MAIEVKKTTKTELKIKSASISNGKFMVDDEVTDLAEALTKVFGTGSFDISIVESVKEDIDIDEIVSEEPTFDDEY